MASSTTMRFPELLKTEATAYAESLGLSLNALCAVALREYLDGRKGSPRVKEPLPAEATPKGVVKPVAASPAPGPVAQITDKNPEAVPLGELAMALSAPRNRTSKKRRRK